MQQNQKLTTPLSWQTEPISYRGVSLTKLKVLYISFMRYGWCVVVELQNLKGLSYSQNLTKTNKFQLFRCRRVDARTCLLFIKLHKVKQQPFTDNKIERSRKKTFSLSIK